MQFLSKAYNRLSRPHHVSKFIRKGNLTLNQSLFVYEQTTKGNSPLHLVGGVRGILYGGLNMSKHAFPVLVTEDNVDTDAGLTKLQYAAIHLAAGMVGVYHANEISALAISQAKDLLQKLNETNQAP
jgi:hypothetical protein